MNESNQLLIFYRLRLIDSNFQFVVVHIEGDDISAFNWCEFDSHSKHLLGDVVLELSHSVVHMLVWGDFHHNAVGDIEVLALAHVLKYLVYKPYFFLIIARDFLASVTDSSRS